MRQLAENEGWRIGWVFDGRNLYAPQMFLPQHETNYKARMRLSAPCACMHELQGAMQRAASIHDADWGAFGCLCCLGHAYSQHICNWLCLPEVAGVADGASAFNDGLSLPAHVSALFISILPRIHPQHTRTFTKALHA